MTAKRKRRRSRSSSPAASSRAEGKARVVDKEPAGKATKTRDEAARPPESPFPPLGTSLARGFRVAGASPAILATAFVSLLVIWAVFVLMGVEPTPGTLALLVSVPPVPILFSDAPLALGPEASGTAIALTVAGLAALRGITFGLMCLLIVQALREGRTSVLDAARALPRVAVVLTGLYLLEFGVVVAAFQLLVGFLGQLAVLLVPAGLYFLVFAMVVAASEGDGPLGALRRGVRAARLPGTRHLSLVMAYFLIFFYARAVAPFGILAPATPSIGAWAYGLVMTFVHVSVLAALVFRWLEVRDRVPADPVAARGS